MDNINIELEQNHISKALTAYLEDLDFKTQYPNDVNGLSTGIKSLDNRLNGIRPGQVILVGGRPAMGKTSFAVNLAYNMATAFSKENTPNKKCILYFNMKTHPKLLSERFITVSVNMSTYDLRNNIYSAEEFTKLAKAVCLLEKLPIYISKNGYDIDTIRQEIVKINSSTPIGCIFIDYLQLMNRKTSDCSFLMNQIKELATSFDIPIVVLSQLTRDVETRADRHPCMTDISDFCKNRVVADKILFLYRESYYIICEEPTKKKNETDKHFVKRLQEWEERCKGAENLCEILIEENSDGRCGCVNTYFNLDTGLFKELPDEQIF